MGLCDYRGVTTPFGRIDAVEDVLWLDPEAIGCLNDSELLTLLRWWEKEGPRIYQEHWDRTRRHETLDGAGCVYFLRRSDGATKIGYTRKLEERLKRLNELAGERLTIVRIIKVDHPVVAEKSAHDRFDKYRIQGEWFKLTDDQINAWRYKENE